VSELLDPELIPEEEALLEEAPELSDAVPLLARLALLIVALGLLEGMSAITNFINWAIREALGPFGFLAGIVQFSLDQVLQPFSNYLSEAEGAIDNEIAISFHKIAQIWITAGKTLLGLATSTFQLGERLGADLAAHTGTQVIVEKITGAEKVVDRTINHYETKVEKIIEQAPRVEHVITQGATVTVHEITHLIEPELEALRDRIGKLEKGAAILWDEAKEAGEGFGISALTAATAAGLAGLGGSWIECEASQLFGRGICNIGPNAIRNLLSGLIDLAALLNLCTLLTLMYETAESSEVQGLLATFTGGIEALINCRGVDTSAAFPIVPLSLPPSLYPYSVTAGRV
jgi:hypothetical protein